MSIIQAPLSTNQLKDILYSFNNLQILYISDSHKENKNLVFSDIYRTCENIKAFAIKLDKSYSICDVMDMTEVFPEVMYSSKTAELKYIYRLGIAQGYPSLIPVIKNICYYR